MSPFGFACVLLFPGPAVLCATGRARSTAICGVLKPRRHNSRFGNRCSRLGPTRENPHKIISRNPIPPTSNSGTSRPLKAQCRSLDTDSQNASGSQRHQEGENWLSGDFLASRRHADQVLHSSSRSAGGRTPPVCPTTRRNERRKPIWSTTYDLKQNA